MSSSGRGRARQRRRPVEKARQGGAATPLPAENEGRAELWARLRQGSRNVAGVSWQLAVSVHVLVMSRAGDLPFTTVVPEGLEDLDCQTTAGDETLVQVKEVSAGAGELTTSRICDAIVHAMEATAGPIGIVTDGQLGGDLEFTGWLDSLDAQRERCGPVTDALVRRGLAPDDAKAVLARVHLVSLPWNLREQTESLLSKRLGVQPAVASFVVGALYEAFGRASADQRHLSLTQARTLNVGDVDATLHAVQSAVDVTGLDAAVAAGVCRPADFSRSDGTSAGQFYLGVDGAPAHIAQGLDVVRVSEMHQITEAAQSEGCAVIIGPSGSGKSVLLWRASRDVILGARVVRVARVASEGDARLLARHVELLRPTLTAPIVVAADNLGRPRMSAWGDAVDALREIPHVFIIGAAREEDFSPHLVRGSARVVKPVLDRATAELIAERVHQAHLTIKMSASEAHARSGGLLMEFLSLLREGKHLEQVLASQAADLAAPGRSVQREAARLVLAAHALGLSLTPGMLAGALAGTTGSPGAVGDALAVLKDEHVLLEGSGVWTGLHELRSQTLTRLLHDSPPPTLADTMSRVARLLRADEAGWLLRRAAERYPDTVIAVADAVADHTCAAGVSATQVAELLEGAERADNAAYAAACLPIMRSLLPAEVSPALVAPFLYSIRNQGTAMNRIGSALYDRMADTFTTVASQLPPRRSPILDAVAGRLGPGRVVTLASEGSLEDGVRLLEAVADTIALSPADAAAIFSAFEAPSGADEVEAWARLIDALVPFVPHDDHVEVFGALEHRASVIARAQPSAVSLSIGVGFEPSITLMHRAEDQGQRADRLWDSPPPAGSDALNEFVVGLTRQFLNACPEAGRVEVITITPSGRRYRVADHEPGHKHIPRDALPDRVGVRRNVGFQGAVRLLLAAATWTGLLAEQARVGQELVDLATDAPYRLRANDRPAARRAWTARLQRVTQRTDELAPPPTKGSDSRALSHAQEDAVRRMDSPVSQALSTAAQALNTFATNENRAAAAIALRDAASKVEQASSTAPTVFGLEQPLSDTLAPSLRHLARAALSESLTPEAWAALRFGDRARVDEIVMTAAQRAHDAQRDLLSEVAAAIPSGQLRLVPDPQPFPGNIDETAWLLTAELEDWEAAIQALADFDATKREALRCNVWLLAVDGGTPTPMGVLMTHHSRQPVLPLTPESLERHATAAGLPLPQISGTFSQEIRLLVDRLLGASWAAALHRRRPAEWPATVPEPGQDTLAAIRLDSAALVGRLSPHIGPEVDASLRVLIDQVEAEVVGATPLTLAGELLDVLDQGPTQAAIQAGIWTALDALSLVTVLMPDLPGTSDEATTP